jgi:hypothetical protein
MYVICSEQEQEQEQLHSQEFVLAQTLILARGRTVPDTRSPYVIAVSVGDNKGTFPDAVVMYTGIVAVAPGTVPNWLYA